MTPINGIIKNIDTVHGSSLSTWKMQFTLIKTPEKKENNREKTKN